MGEPAWSRTRRGDDERFAGAVDSGIGAAEFGTELAVVAALRRLGRSVPVEPDTRERIAQRITDTRPRRRPLPVLTTAAVALAALACLALLLAKDALPGEPLYHLKRAQEAATLGLTFDAEDDAARRLSYASRRLDEITTLGRHGVRDTDTYRLALADFTEHATEGASELTALATRTDGRGLTVLAAWAQRESAGLAAAEAALPTTVSTDVTTLLDRIERRSAALAERMECYEITSVHSDDLGALPAAGGCAPSPAKDHAGKPRPPAPSERAARPEPRNGHEPPSADEPTAFVEHPHAAEADTRTPLRPADVAAAPVVSHVPSPDRPRLPTPEPEDPALVSIAPILPGLPAVTVG
ncbi:DUF5667 domain-containing protein [Saccharomonospora cyanea]|uniref:DUF5667 domain-containing protein n=1 Tax=Saccharomonospora cyanea NA-134 TaxID=882082 RepID=H5XER3_9PSEU|nr:DUF5667 domain-containing protein [Saccharomonospora cyanea]EHR59292.1 hypothetical protein SaccyDRAFT_0357 [Saccharomonospora cyanea NA-134]